METEWLTEREWLTETEWLTEREWLTETEWLTEREWLTETEWLTEREWLGQVQDLQTFYWLDHIISSYYIIYYIILNYIRQGLHPDPAIYLTVIEGLASQVRERVFAR